MGLSPDQWALSVSLATRGVCVVEERVIEILTRTGDMSTERSGRVLGALALAAA
jgi:hypothetical protein